MGTGMVHTATREFSCRCFPVCEQFHPNVFSFMHGLTLCTPDYTACRLEPASNPWTLNPKESWLIARQWLQRCKLNHTKCKAVSSRGRLPTRLIDVGDVSHPRLALGASLDENTDFATLSHCWGLKKQLMLREDNLDLFLNEIPVDELPQLHKEVFEATSKLGIRYLWVDSFCILQDSNDDWSAESAAMDQVYENAVVNLAASNAKDSSESLYAQRNPPLKEFSRPIRMCVDGVEGDYYASVDDIEEKNFSHSMLNTRAWVLQELFLSRRTIYFCKEQVFWMCRESQACEIFPEQSRGETRWNRLQAIRDRGLLEGWSDIVELYTRAQLSQPDKDMLVALSGLAKRAHDPSEYCAGLWASQFPHNLLWYFNEDGQGKRALTLQAPSWSWASADEEVRFLEKSREQNQFPRLQVAQVLDCRMSPKTRNRMGPICSGLLKVRGLVLKSKVSRVRYSFRSIRTSWLFVESPELKFDFLRLDTTVPNETDEYYFFLACLKLSAFNGKREAFQFQGLVLQRTANNAEYRRIGVFYVTHKDRFNTKERMSSIYAQGLIEIGPEELVLLQNFENCTVNHDAEDVLNTCSSSMFKLPLTDGPSEKESDYRDIRVCEIAIS